MQLVFIIQPVWNHNQNYDIFLYLYISCWSVIYHHGNKQKTCLFNFCIINAWRIKSPKKIVQLNYFFYNCISKWTTIYYAFQYIRWLNKTIGVYLTELQYSVVIVRFSLINDFPSFVLLSKLSVMNGDSRVCNIPHSVVRNLFYWVLIVQMM